MAFRGSFLSFLKHRARNVEMMSLKLAGLLPNHYLRVGMLKAWGADVAPTATVYHGFEAREVRNLTIGARSIIGNGAVLDARGGLRIGNDVNFSTAVHVWTAQHDWQAADFAYERAPVVIGDRAWLGPRVTILPGVTIGAGAVVAAGAVVSSAVPASTLVGGVPARVLQNRGPVNYQLASRRKKAWWW